MHPPPALRALLLDPRTRTAFAGVVATAWFLFAVSAESGRNAAPTVIVGIPAMAVLFWWRLHPLRAVLLSALALLLILVTASLASPGGGVLIAVSTAWFAVLGALASDDRRARWAGAALAGVYGLIALLFLFGYGNSANFFVVAFLLAIAVGLGWGARQVRRTTWLEANAGESARERDAAERDVLVELERNRIAREVHDVVAHSLAVVIAQADGARFAAETKPETVAPALEAISDTARRALGEVRTMLHDLRTSGGGEAPGAEDLAELVDGVRGLGVPVDEVVYGSAAPLDRAVGLALYRIAQEALTNAMRHGDRGEPVGFEVDWGERQVVLIVTNAVPREAVPATERAGQGLVGMRERALDAGGDCTAGVGSSGRFRVRVALPVQVASAEPERAPDALGVLLGRVGLEAHG